MRLTDHIAVITGASSGIGNACAELFGLRYDYWSPFLVPRHTVPYFNERTGELRYVLQNPLDYLSRHGPDKREPRRSELPAGADRRS